MPESKGPWWTVKLSWDADVPGRSRTWLLRANGAEAAHRRATFLWMEFTSLGTDRVTDVQIRSLEGMTGFGWALDNEFVTVADPLP